MIPRWFGSPVSAFGRKTDGAVDGAVDVDLAGAAGERLDEAAESRLPPACGDQELGDAVDGVDRDPAAEPGERAPVVARRRAARARRPRARGRRSGSGTSRIPSRTARARRPCRGCRSRSGRRARRRAKNPSSDRGRRGDPRPRDHDVADDEADREDVRERDAPPKLQCTFSKVQQKSVARKKKLVTLLMSLHGSSVWSRSASSCTRVRRESFVRHSSASGDRLEPARRASGRASPSARARSRRCRRARRRRRRRSPGSASAAAPSGGTTARIGRSAARYSNTFPERMPRPRPPASGIRSSSASESRCSSSARRCGA